MFVLSLCISPYFLSQALVPSSPMTGQPFHTSNSPWPKPGFIFFLLKATTLSNFPLSVKGNMSECPRFVTSVPSLILHFLSPTPHIPNLVVSTSTFFSVTSSSLPIQSPHYLMSSDPHHLSPRALSFNFCPCPESLFFSTSSTQLPK